MTFEIDSIRTQVACTPCAGNYGGVPHWVYSLVGRSFKDTVTGGRLVKKSETEPCWSPLSAHLSGHRVWFLDSHARTQARICTRTHTRLYSRMNARTCARARTHTLSLSHTHTHTHTRSLSLSLSLSRTHAHTHTHTHTHTHMRAHTYACTHARLCTLADTRIPLTRVGDQ